MQKSRRQNLNAKLNAKLKLQNNFNFAATPADVRRRTSRKRPTCYIVQRTRAKMMTDGNSQCTGQRSGFSSTRAYLWSLSVSGLNLRLLRSLPICCRALLWLLLARARLLRLFVWTNIVLISNHPQNRPRPDLQDGPGQYLLLNALSGFPLSYQIKQFGKAQRTGR